MIELQAVCNQLEDVENEVYSLDDELEEKNYHEIDINKIMISLDIVIVSVGDLMKTIEKEESLIRNNKTLRALYEEYTTIRDLIGSEK